MSRDEPTPSTSSKPSPSGAPAPGDAKSPLQQLGAIAAQLAFAGAALVGVFLFVYCAKNDELRRICTPTCSLRPNYANHNRLAPDFELPTLAGETKKLSDYRGKVVIMNFWTKTCRPCLEEMPALSNLAQVLQDYPGVELVTVTTDESADDARSTLRSVLNRDPNFTTFVDADNTIVADQYGTKLYPETWFIDPKGVIRARIDGARDWMDPLHLELALSLDGPRTCPVTIERREPDAAYQSLCGTIPIAL